MRDTARHRVDPASDVSNRLRHRGMGSIALVAWAPGFHRPAVSRPDHRENRQRARVPMSLAADDR